jgi:hypothetical protein
MGRVLKLIVIAAAALTMLVACATTGRSFDSSALELLVPGQTTLAEASALMDSDPVDVYRQLDGATTARWAHKASFVPDAIYFNQELWLAFDAQGHFLRVVETTNIPRAYKSGKYPSH